MLLFNTTHIILTTQEGSPLNIDQCLRKLVQSVQ